MKRNSALYAILLGTCIAAFSWLGLNHFLMGENLPGLVVCPIRNVTSYPCPSCGLTRALLLLGNGKLWLAIKQNPLSLPVALGMLVVTILLIRDLLLKSSVLEALYDKMERSLRRPYFSIPFALLILLTWIWNIYYQR